MTDSECAFCEIAQGRGQADFVFQTPDFVAFFPLSPATLGHTLVVPRRHVPDVWSLPLQLVGPLLETAVDVGAALREVVHPEGMNVIHSAGEAATQTVFHLHVHLVPRWSNDAVGNFWPDASSSPSQFEQNAALEAVRDVLNM